MGHENILSINMLGNGLQSHVLRFWLMTHPHSWSHPAWLGSRMLPKPVLVQELLLQVILGPGQRFWVVAGNWCLSPFPRVPEEAGELQVCIYGHWLREYFPVIVWVPGDSADENDSSVIDCLTGFLADTFGERKKKKSECFIQETPCKTQFL